MVYRIFNLLTACSMALLCLVLVAWPFAGSVDPRTQFVSLSRDCHFSIHGRLADARLVVFSDSNYGPYTGSILSIAGDPNAPSVSGFGDTAGIYYRHISRPDGQSLWTLSLSLLYPLIATSVLPIIWIIRRSRRAPRGFPVGLKSVTHTQPATDLTDSQTKAH